MNDQITSAAQLDALPVGSVVARLHNDGYGNSVYTLHEDGWKAATEPLRPGVGPRFDQDDERMADLTVLYRPDEPQRVQPSREDVARALFAHRHPNEFWGSGGSEGRREWYAAEADAVLALWPGRTEAEVKAEALREAALDVFALCMHIDGLTCCADCRDSAGWLRERADRLEAEARHG